MRKLIVAVLLLVINFPQTGRTFEINKAAVKVDNLGTPIESAILENSFYIQLPGSRENHFLLYYVTLQYSQRPFQIIDLNLDTGRVRVVDGVLGRSGGQTTIIHSNGKVFVASGAPGYLMVYDPQKGTSQTITKLADNNAQCVIEGDDGAVYVGESIKGYVERYDPKTGAWENYGIIDDPGSPYYRYAYTLGSDGRYIYIAMGQKPWYLVIYDRLNKTQKVYWKDQKLLNVSIERGQNGGWFAYCKTKQGKDCWYKLQGGQDPELLKLRPMVVPRRVVLRENAMSKFGIDLDQAIPDSGNGGKVMVRWRKGIGQKWQKALAQLRIAPMDIKRLYITPDSKLFGFTSFYGPVFKYDPSKKDLIILGRPQRSLYDALLYGGEWYLVGYPTTTMNYNPAKPWTISASTAALLNDPLKNPRLIKVAPEGMAKYHYYLARGSDGSLYFGGHHERDSVGGSLGWFHPKTGVTGGLREPFLKYDVSDLIAAEEGSKIIFSSQGVEKGIDGRIFIFDVQQKKLSGDFAPLPGVQDTGKLLEVAPGMIIGVAVDPPRSIIYKADLQQRQVIWKKEVAGRAFGSVRGFDRRLIQGPDGKIWLYLNNTICRLDPDNGDLQKIVDAPPAANLLFFKQELYIYGRFELRKISGLFGTNPK